MSVTVSLCKDATTAFHDDQQHIRSLGVQQCIGINTLRIKNTFELFLQCFLTEVFIFSLLVFVCLHSRSRLAER